MKYDIEVLGPYPPPFGGVSIHVKRLHESLKDRGVSSCVYDQYNTSDSAADVYPTNMKAMWWLKYFFKKKPKIVHFHIFSIIQYVYIFLLSLLNQTNIVISIHNEKILSMTPLVRYSVLFFLRYSKLAKIIVVSECVYEKLRLWGVTGVCWIPAYIPPLVESSRALCGTNKIKILYNASTVKNDVSKNVYGFDIILDLARQNPKCDFCLFIGDEASERLISSSTEFDDLNNCYFYFNENMVDFMSSANVFIRPNREDAFGISVQEALDLGVPAIASDVCTRSKGAILFSVENTGELNEKLMKVISQSKSDSLQGYSATTYLNELFDVYASLGIDINEY